MTKREIVEAVLRYFDWGNYGLDEVSIALSEYPEYQEWVTDLAAQIVNALEKP